MSVAQSPVIPPGTEIVSVTRGTVEKSVDSSGKVVSNLDVEIKCRASGEVITLPFDISQPVKKGDLLCQLDPTDEQLAVRAAEAVVAQSTAKLEQARNDYRQAEEHIKTSRSRDEVTLASAKVKAANLRMRAERRKPMVQGRQVSQEDLDTSETEAANAEAERGLAEVAMDELKQQEIQLEYKAEAIKMVEAQLQSDEIYLINQKQQLAYATVTSPIDGVVSALHVQNGAIVASGMSGFSGGTPILTISDLSRVFIIATVDESDIGEVRIGQPARAAVASFPNRMFAGKVVRIGTRGVNLSNVVTFEVKIEILDDHKDLLRPEMTGTATIVQDERKDVLMLPNSAITTEQAQAFITDDSGHRHAVTLGLQGPEMTEVVSGASEGERVAVISAELPSRWKTKQMPGGGPPPPQ